MVRSTLRSASRDDVDFAYLADMLGVALETWPEDGLALHHDCVPESARPSRRRGHHKKAG